MSRCCGAEDGECVFPVVFRSENGELVGESVSFNDGAIVGLSDGFSVNVVDGDCIGAEDGA